MDHQVQWLLVCAKPETRNPKPETRNPKSSNLKGETRNAQVSSSGGMAVGVSDATIRLLDANLNEQVVMPTIITTRNP